MAILTSVPVSAQTVTIAALGDSLTHGYGLAQEDGFVPRLEAWLRSEGEDVVVLNAGVSGDTTAGGLARVDWTLTPDVDGMIVALGGNDMLRGIDPANSRANIEGILKIAANRNLPVLLVGLPAPGNYGPDYKAEFDAIYPELATAYGVLHYENFLAALSDGDAATARHMQADGLHPNARGVLAIVRAMGPSVRALITAVRTLD